MQLDRVFDIVNQVPSPWNIILWWLIVIGAVAYVGSRTFRFVPQGQKAMRTRWRKVVFKNDQPVYLEPGLHVMWPWMHGLELVSTLDRTFELQRVQLLRTYYDRDNVFATVTFAVRSVFLVRYAVDNFEARVVAASAHQLGRVLEMIPGGDIRKQRDLIVELFGKEIAAKATELGIELRSIDITNIEGDAQFATAGSQALIADAIAGRKSKGLLEKVATKFIDHLRGRVRFA